MPCPWAFVFKDIYMNCIFLMGSMTLSNLCVKRLQSYKPSKLVVKKNSIAFGSKATFFVNLYSDSLLFGRPGFDSQLLKNLSTYSFDIYLFAKKHLGIL